MSNKRYEELFNLGIRQLREREEMLTVQLEKCTAQRDRFKEVINDFKRLSEASTS